MQPLPVPCPAHLIPDASATSAFHTAYRQAMAHRAVFVAIESDGPRWTVKADTLTAGPEYSLDDAVNDAVRAAIDRLVRNREVGLDAYPGPVYFMMHSVTSEDRARELAAALQRRLARGPGTTQPGRPSHVLTRTPLALLNPAGLRESSRPRVPLTNVS
ncbi:hypothetical protein [Streptomyces sp. NPDC014744]|uniref:hypothetical protein n=1 Tax=Streptomyces sp. NPDC014744 TaxID=3364903 RepID=UPI0036FB8D6C